VSGISGQTRSKDTYGGGFEHWAAGQLELFHPSFAQYLRECHSQFVGHRRWFLSSGLDNRDENHPMAVRVNDLWIIYTRTGTLPQEPSG